MSATHPDAKRVPVQGGASHVDVRPWTMAQRRTLRPLLADLFTKVLTLQDSERPTGGDLVEVFLVAEDEVAEIVKASISPDIKWDELYWEDLPVLAQAVWDTSITREGDGGLVGKTAGMLVKLFTNSVPSLLTKQTEPSSPDSVSSPESGEETPSDSGTPSPTASS